MAGLILPNRFTTQPQYSAPLDKQGLGKGMKMLFNPSQGTVDLVNGRKWPISNATLQDSVNGRIINFDGSNDYLSYTGYPELNSNIGTFFLWAPRVGNASQFGHIPLVAESSPLTWYQIDASNFVWLLGNQSSGTISWFNTTNRSLVFVSGGTAASCKLYVDGVDSGLTWSSTPVSFVAGDKNFRIGMYSAANSWDMDASILSLGFTSALWSAEESREYHRSKGNSLFKAQPRRLWTVAASSASSFTINPTGGITLSGTTNLIKTKIINPTGGVTFSGTSPVVGTRSFTINPSGGITFSGTAPITFTGSNTYVITPSGGVSLSGSSPLIKTHLIIPTGSIVFSGSSPIESNTVISVYNSRLPLTGMGN